MKCSVLIYFIPKRIGLIALIIGMPALAIGTIGIFIGGTPICPPCVIYNYRF